MYINVHWGAIRSLVAWGRVVARQFQGARHGLDEALTAELKEYCKAHDMIASKVIVRALREYLERQKVLTAKAVKRAISKR